MRELWMGLGVVGVAAVVLAAASAEAPTGQTVSAGSVPTWGRRVVAIVSAAEGRADSLNRNLDGNGLSFGILQWTQRSGSLGTLLGAMADADVEAFARIFGPSWSAVVAAAQVRSLAAIDGAALWEEPWASRFIAAGRYAPFVEVQWRLALDGEYFRGAEAVAKTLGVRTERSMALFFDRCVHQGPATAAKVAGALRARLATRGPVRVEQMALLRTYADDCAGRFRRVTAPETLAYSKYSPNVLWVPVGMEWHAKAGPWDLYQTVVDRTRAILADRRLSDSNV